MSAEERYNSIYTGTEIDAALGRIISGDIDEAVKKAEAAQAGAEAAQTKAETAQAAAETASQGAETAQKKAETAQAAAESARQGAETAQAKAETAQTAAEAAKTAAQQAAAEASTSAQQAAESAAALSETIADVSDLKAGLAKNTEADAKTARSLDALWKLNQGVSYQFETDTTEAYSKTVPTGAKCADVQMIGGKTVVWNQLVDSNVSAVTPISGHKIVSCVGGVWAISTSDGSEMAVTGGTDMVFDLTKLYGVGNEPTSTDDPRIAWIEQYAAAHPEYNAGELVSADVESVINHGRNLFGGDALSDAIVRKVNSATVDIKNRTITYAASDISGKDLFNEFKPNTQYSIFMKTESPCSNLQIVYTDGTTSIDLKNVLYRTTEGKSVAALRGLWNSGSTTLNIDECGIYEGEIDHFSPYKENVFQIPDSIRALIGYGWSAGDVYNSIERTDAGWKYVRRVGYCDLGTLNYSYDATNKDFYSTDLNHIIKKNTNDEIANIICHMYTAISRNSFVETSLTADKLVFVNSAKILGIRNLAYTDAAAFKAAMSGVILRFEREEPVITGITDIMTLDFDAIPVEAGGTVTFDNAAQLAVPNSLEYAVKLSEVST